jgi:hypothetical protein
VTRIKNQSDTPKPHATKHLVVPIFHNESAADLEGFTEGKPGAGRIVAIKSVIFSDGSAKRYYRVEATKKIIRNKTFKKRAQK